MGYRGELSKMVADFRQRKEQILRALPKLPPSNIEAEEAILGGILLDPHAFSRVKDNLKPEHFYVDSHKLLYKRICELSSSNNVTDFMSVKSYLEDKNDIDKVGGVIKLTQLLDRTVSAVNIDMYATLVIEKALQRQAIAIGHNIIDFSMNYHHDCLNDWYEERELNQKDAYNNPGLFLELIEKQVHELTRSRYRESLSIDSETVRARQLIDQIKDIENNCKDLVSRRFKKMSLAKRYKISEKQLESLYLASLIGDQNEPIQSLASLREKYGDDVNEWFIQGMLPKGCVTLLHALGGVGKTRLAYDFCYSMVTGQPWGSEFPVTAPSRRCLLVQTDESQGDMIRTLNGRGFNDYMPMYAKTKWTFDHLVELREEIIENKIEVVVIDSLTSVNRNAVVSENDTEYARPILQLKDMAQELGITVLIIHHSNSEGKSRGTKAIHNSVSQVLSLRFPSEGSETSIENRLLVIEKSRFRRPTSYKLSFVFDEENYQWSWLCEGEQDEEPAVTTLKDRIVKFFEENRNVMLTAHDISEKLKFSYNTVRKILFQLSELDQVIGRKKEGRSWLHFLRWQSDLSDLSDLQGVDHKGSCHSQDFGLSDPPNAKIENKESNESEKIEDHKINNREKPQGTLAGQGDQDGHISDPSHHYNTDLVLTGLDQQDHLNCSLKYLGSDPDILIRFKYAKSLKIVKIEDNGMVIVEAESPNRSKGRKISRFSIPAKDLD